MDSSAYESGLRNLHSWAGHLWSTLESVLPRAAAELGPPGDETMQDVRNAAQALHAVAESLANVMAAYDLVRESAGRSRRYGDFLRSLEGEAASLPVSGDEDDGPAPEISRTHYSRLESELHYDAGWLLGAIHGAMICGRGEHSDGHLEGLANGIEELMISYDRIQDLIGVMAPRHCVFFDEMAVLQEEPRRRRRGT